MTKLTDKVCHQLPAEEVAQFLGVNSSTGLSADKLEQRLRDIQFARVWTNPRQSDS